MSAYRYFYRVGRDQRGIADTGEFFDLEHCLIIAQTHEDADKHILTLINSGDIKTAEYIRDTEPKPEKIT